MSPRSRPRGQSLTILHDLNFNPDEWESFSLGLDYSSGFAINIEQRVYEPMTTGEREVSEGDATRNAEVG